MRSRILSLELITLFYMLAYLPYIMMTRFMATQASQALGRPLTGLEMMPAMMLAIGVFTYGFMWISGWSKDISRLRFMGLSLPGFTRWTFWSGVCTAVILTTVPLSYTFRDVSIPFIQLLMRGDILIIAPLVDLLSRRRVHWWSWAALGLVSVAMAITLQARGGLKLPPIALTTVILYTAAYFFRLWIMSRRAKTADVNNLRVFFSEEKVVAFPVSLLVLAAIPLFGLGASQSAQLGWGFVQIWTAPQLPFIVASAFLVMLTGVFSGIILLDARENSFCVPLERSASILAGIIGSVLLAVFAGGMMPPTAEIAGALLLIVAVMVLAIGPRISARNSKESSA